MMRRRFNPSLLLFVHIASVVCANPADAKVRNIRLRELIKQSDYVLLARVSWVVRFDGLHVAMADPIDVFKGEPRLEPIYFVADSTWTCDTSTAVRGETALLFLTKAKSQRVDLIGRKPAKVKANPLYFISHSGRGRMPLKTIDGWPCVNVQSEVLLPASVQPIPRPIRPYIPGRWVPQTDVVTYVSK